MVSGDNNVIVHNVNFVYADVFNVNLKGSNISDTLFVLVRMPVC